jgi:hypothetical protein
LPCVRTKLQVLSSMFGQGRLCSAQPSPHCTHCRRQEIWQRRARNLRRCKIRLSLGKVRRTSFRWEDLTLFQHCRMKSNLTSHFLHVRNER